MNRHTTFRIGKRCRVVLKSKEVFVDRLTDRSDKFLKFEGRGRVFKQDILSCAHYRPQPNQEVVR